MSGMMPDPQAALTRAAAWTATATTVGVVSTMFWQEKWAFAIMLICYTMAARATYTYGDDLFYQNVSFDAELDPTGRMTLEYDIERRRYGGLRRRHDIERTFLRAGIATNLLVYACAQQHATVYGVLGWILVSFTIMTIMVIEIEDPLDNDMELLAVILHMIAGALYTITVCIEGFLELFWTAAYVANVISAVIIVGAVLFFAAKYSK